MINNRRAKGMIYRIILCCLALQVGETVLGSHLAFAQETLQNIAPIEDSSKALLDKLKANLYIPEELFQDYVFETVGRFNFRKIGRPNLTEPAIILWRKPIQIQIIGSDEEKVKATIQYFANYYPGLTNLDIKLSDKDPNFIFITPSSSNEIEKNDIKKSLKKTSLYKRKEVADLIDNSLENYFKKPDTCSQYQPDVDQLDKEGKRITSAVAMIVIFKAENTRCITQGFKSSLGLNGILFSSPQHDLLKDYILSELYTSGLFYSGMPASEAIKKLRERNSAVLQNISQQKSQ